MTFDEAFALPLGAVLSVSNGRPAPPEGPTLRWRCWRSNNFTGPLLSKAEGPPRALLIEAVNEPGLRVAYEIVEGRGHSFSLVE